MKKRLLRALLVLCALLIIVMVLSFAACGKKAEPTVSSESETAAPTTVSQEKAGRELSLTESSLSVTTWSSPNGATVNLTAVPSEHANGDTAEFVVRLDGENIKTVPCEWKSGAYVASADLNGADGYGYYVTLSGKDGSFAEVAVNTPENPTDESLINLASSLMPYCSVTLNDTALEGDSLTILSGYALVQAPRITGDGDNVACAQANLVMTLDGQEIGRIPLVMAPGEADRSYDATITDLSFTVPEEIGEGQQLVLRLEAELTNGQTLTAQGGSWTAQDGIYSSTVG
ncbi:MAG: hypothetical protein MSS60_05050 [Clostridiales bacterium]|nr:hypothetical protein [Clostridiales bacterium]